MQNQFNNALAAGDLSKTLFCARLHHRKTGEYLDKYLDLLDVFHRLEKSNLLFERRLLLSCIHEYKEIQAQAPFVNQLLSAIGPFAEISFQQKKDLLNSVQTALELPENKITALNEALQVIEEQIQLLKAEEEWAEELWIPIADLQRKKWNIFLENRLTQLLNLEDEAKKNITCENLHKFIQAKDKATSALSQARARYNKIQNELENRKGHTLEERVREQHKAQVSFKEFLEATEKSVEQKSNIIKEQKIILGFKFFNDTWRTAKDRILCFDDTRTSITQNQIINICTAVKQTKTWVTCIDSLIDNEVALSKATSKAVEQYKEHKRQLNRNVFPYYTEVSLNTYWKIKNEALELCKEAHYKDAAAKIRDARSIITTKSADKIKDEIAEALKELELFDEEYNNQKGYFVIYIGKGPPLYAEKAKKAEKAEKAKNNIHACIEHIRFKFKEGVDFMPIVRKEVDSSLSPFDAEENKKIDEEIKKVDEDLLGNYGSFWQRITYWLKHKFT